MRWHALARANGQGQIATPNFAVSHVLHDAHGRLRDWHIHDMPGPFRIQMWRRCACATP